MSKIYIGFILFFSFSLLSCAKDGANIIPDVPVNFSAPINDPRLSRLNGAGGAVVISGYGYAGLILYRRPDGAIVAYDRCSTVNPLNKCQLNLSDPTITATDPCSGAIFLLSDGSPAKAPATRPLKQYQVTVTSFQISVLN
ncbi:Rieske (2Fe-2S) protein [Pedobacter cryophilus]|uniref:Rieske domain-containing protein n=1 Tax=Pedobacter cryophilus TaxID=2571271 RepID=A0A4U1BUF7_9SPHI|nr:hypothetical protein [Pedobacter cryophilus]TKB96312.1 hypothetical protein FA046_14095 [Pedobacter cryophilus]